MSSGITYPSLVRIHCLPPFHRTVVNLVLGLKLSGGMNRAVVSMVGILSEDTNRGSFVRDNLGGSVDELEGVESSWLSIPVTSTSRMYMGTRASLPKCHHWRLYP
jgi:hypothetical protein